MTSEEIKQTYSMRDILNKCGLPQPNRSGFIQCPFHKGDREASMKIYDKDFNCFQKTLNLLLTAEIDNEEWKPVLEALGVECTLESALLMAQIKAALAGDTQAAKFVAQYSGQSNRAEEDLENKKAETELIKARKESITGENENNDALDRLDQILKEVRDNAIKQETE